MKTIALKTGELAHVDDEDYVKVSALKWYRKVSTSGSIYAVANLARVNGKGGRIYMHRMVMSAGKGGQIDHRDGNPLNNCRSNLRVLLGSDNQRAFSKKKPNTSSRFRGVFWEAQAQTWRARVERKAEDGRRRIVNAGSFQTEVDAALAYNAAAQKLGFLPEAMNLV
jgi:hypothetical protein